LGDAVQATAPESAVTAKRVLLVVAAGLGGAALATGVWLYLQGMLAPKPMAIAATPPVLPAAQPAVPPSPAPANEAAKSEAAPVTTLPVPRAAGLATAPVATPTVPAGRAQSVKPVAPAPAVAVTALPASAPTSTSAAPAGASEPPGLSPATVVAQTAGAKTYSPKQVAGNLMAQAVTLDREGRLDEAKQPLRQLLVTNPDDLAARQMLVQLDIDTGRLDDARELLEAGLRQHPGNPGLAWTLARLKAESGDVSGAITLLDGVRGGARTTRSYTPFRARCCCAVSVMPMQCRPISRRYGPTPPTLPGCLGLGQRWKARARPPTRSKPTSVPKELRA
jgi:hypothetical protein